MTYPTLKSMALLSVAVVMLSACGPSDEQDALLPASTVTSTVSELRVIDATETSVGRLEADTAPTVAAETSGRVVEILVDAGDRVSAGQALARLDGDTQRAANESAKGEVQQLTALSANQQKRVERLAGLVEGNLVSKDQFEEAQAQAKALASQLGSAQARLTAAQLDLNRIEIRAPVTGEVQRRHVSVGDFVQPGQAVFELVSADALKAVFPVPQRLASAIEVGQNVHIYQVGEPQDPLVLPITEIRPEVGAQSRALQVVVALNNPGLWRAGSSVTGEIVLRQTEAVVVPPSAVVRRPSGNVVYVIDQNQSVAIEQPVTVGLRHSDWVEVIDGLAPDVLVVLDGAGFLTDGARLNVVNADDAHGVSQ